MTKTIEQRLEALKKAGFRITKHRELKSGTQYKIRHPKALEKWYSVFHTRIGLEDAVNFAEGMMVSWESVAGIMKRDVAALAGRFGMSLK